MDVIDAAARGDLVLVLAIGLVTLAGVIGYLFRLFLKVSEERRVREEKLTDKAIDAFDKLADTTGAALDELRKR